MTLAWKRERGVITNVILSEAKDLHINDHINDIISPILTEE